VLLFSLVTPVYSLYFCIVLFTRFNKLNDDDESVLNSKVVYPLVCLDYRHMFHSSVNLRSI